MTYQTNNQKNGAAFEKRLSACWDYMAALGQAHIVKVPTPMRPVGMVEKGRCMAVFCKSRAVDYQGVLRGGFCCCLEAKFTESEKVEAERVSASQTDELDHFTAMGAVCGVLLCFSFSVFAFVPWPVWREMKAVLGRKYITAADCKAHGWAYDGASASALAERLLALRKCRQEFL